MRSPIRFNRNPVSNIDINMYNKWPDINGGGRYLVVERTMWLSFSDNTSRLVGSITAGGTIATNAISNIAMPPRARIGAVATGMATGALIYVAGLSILERNDRKIGGGNNTGENITAVLETPCSTYNNINKVKEFSEVLLNNKVILMEGMEKVEKVHSSIKIILSCELVILLLTIYLVLSLVMTIASKYLINIK